MGQISILLFCMEYILKITNQRFDNPIILYNKVATAAILKTKSIDFDLKSRLLYFSIYYVIYLFIYLFLSFFFHYFSIYFAIISVFIYFTTFIS